MARIVYDGNFKVRWLDTAPANPAAPTVAEWNAGTDLTPFVPKDGFASGGSNNRVAGGDLSTAFAGESMGTWGSQLSVTAFLDDATAGNVAYDTIGVRGATGAIVVSPFGAPAAGDLVYVWPDVEAGQPIHPSTAENERQKFTAEFAVRAEPQFHARMAV